MLEELATPEANGTTARHPLKPEISGRYYGKYFLVDGEAKTDGDRAKIARVIYNRLGIGMPLAIDAAVRYGTLQAGLDPDTVPFSDQRNMDTPWNTYMHEGLPPTPIANPGRASIQAALNPAPNPSVGDPICADLPEDTPCTYLFYVLADEDGKALDKAIAELEAAELVRQASPVLPRACG